MNIKKIGLLFTLMIFITNITSAQVSETQLFKLKQVFENISENYTDNVDGKMLVETAIKATLKKLDPHSSYFTKFELEDLKRGLQGSFTGIGITYNVLKDTLLILSTSKDGPSEKAGLLPGDRVIYVDTNMIAGIKVTSKEIRNVFVGKIGTTVDIFIKRYGYKNMLKFTVTRDKIPLYSVNAAYMADKKTAYIKLRRFAATSVKEINEKIKELKKKGAKQLILDLRNNGGGYLSTAVKLSDMFLTKNKLIVFTKGINSKLKEYKSTKKQKFENSRVVVLTNENSASASEILSGALQDWDRAVIVGRRTYGKGLVQRPFYLIDGSMVRLTIARYYTPTGRFIQKPYDKGQNHYLNEIGRRLKNGELMHADSIKFPDSLKHYTLEKKRLIYGGGGIMPDIFVPLDTTAFPASYKELARTNKINKFIHYYVDINRSFFTKKYKTFGAFNKKYSIPQTITDSLALRYKSGISKKEKVKISNEMFKNQNVKNRLKALIANDLWGEQEYYFITNTKSNAYKKALEVINDKQLYNSILKQ